MNGVVGASGLYYDSAIGKEEVKWNEKLHIEMLLIFAINENCCSFDWGRGICPLFPSPRQEHLAAQVSLPRGNWSSKAKKKRKKRKEAKEKKAYALGVSGGGGGMGAAGIAW